MKFEDIRIYDRDFNLLTIFPRYISVNWELKFCGYGTGEIQLEKNDEIVRILTENKYLFIVQGHIQSIVTGYKIGEICTVFTRTLEWLLTRYAVGKFTAADIMNYADISEVSTEALVEYVLTENLHTDFNLVFVGGGAEDSDMSEFVLDRASDVYSVIKSVVKNPETGFLFYRDFNQGCFVFEMKKANENKEVILCDKYKTSYNAEYNHDIQNEASGGIFYHQVTNMGKWDASQNQPEITTQPSNYGKYYTVSADGKLMGTQVYKGDIIFCRRRDGVFEVVEKAEPFLVEIPPEDNGIFSWTTALLSHDMVSAQNELYDKKPLDMVNCMTGLSYMEDFNLGDIVRVRFIADGIYSESRKLISEVHIWDEANDSGAYPTMTDIV